MGHLRFDLKEAIQDYEARTGIRLTYEALGIRTGIATDTLKSMASREDYNATLRAIGSLADALKCDPIRHMKWTPGRE